MLPRVHVSICFGRGLRAVVSEYLNTTHLDGPDFNPKDTSARPVQLRELQGPHGRNQTSIWLVDS